MGNSERSPLQKSSFQKMVQQFGLPRLIIAGFLLLLFIVSPFVGADLPTQISNTINRFSWNAVMVLAMVPMVHSGCGLNFGLPLGIISGLLGATITLELGFRGLPSFFMAILIATPFALVLGAGYGWMLNKIKGGEMMVATYVGFSSVSFMCMMWLLLPYSNPTMVWGLSGKGLRTDNALVIHCDDEVTQMLAKNALPDLEACAAEIVGHPIKVKLRLAEEQPEDNSALDEIIERAHKLEIEVTEY